ncbi:MAG: hypothetical protein FJW39_22005 [Acidobacteria bacterium]|nr:hypothetical protein [Acidobacteriota bacterium]
MASSTVRILFAATLLLSACSNEAPKVFELPREITGGWQRTHPAEVPVAEAPERVRGLGVRTISRAGYAGPWEMQATVYTMGSEASAFELVQKWRPAPGEIFFQAGPRFVLITAPGQGAPELRRVAAALESAIGK